jgi:hypothetical protein
LPREVCGSGSSSPAGRDASAHPGDQRLHTGQDLVGIRTLLAPQRKVSILGAADDFSALVGAVYVRSLKMTGFVYGDQLPCR